MRIISKFKDYYDCVQAYGQESDCVWVRNLYKLNFKHKYDCPLPVDIIGFCGKLYPFVRLEEPGIPFPKVYYCYTTEQIDDFFIKYFSHDKKFNGYYYDTSKFPSFTSKYYNIYSTRKTYEYFLKNCYYENSRYNGQTLNNYAESLFLNHKCPLFICLRNHSVYGFDSNENYQSIIFCGPQLKIDGAIEVSKPQSFLLRNFEFYKVIDTQQTFQNIQQYLSGVLGFNNPVVPVPDDITMRDIKGFDKYSFRKDKQK